VNFACRNACELSSDLDVEVFDGLIFGKLQTLLMKGVRKVFESDYRPSLLFFVNRIIVDHQDEG
jgi:hypothetical protein